MYSEPDTTGTDSGFTEDSLYTSSGSSYIGGHHQGSVWQKTRSFFAVDLSGSSAPLCLQLRQATMVPYPSLSRSLSYLCTAGACSPTVACRGCKVGLKSYDNKIAWYSSSYLFHGGHWTIGQTGWQCKYCIRKPQVWELSRLWPEFSNKIVRSWIRLQAALCSFDR